MAQYKTPNVYVKEQSTLPPSVAEVATAIPAFIGYTEITTDKIDDSISIVNKPNRITNMSEYEAIYGGAYSEDILVDFNEGAGEFFIPQTEATAMAKFFLYQSVQQFFANGGGACYVVSTGGYESPNDDTTEGAKPTKPTVPAKADFVAALTAVEQVDEVTLFVMPESVTLAAQEHYDLHNAALDQASRLQDRFAIIDVQQSSILAGSARDDAALMRDKVVGDLKYGATYYPYLRSTLARSYQDETATVLLKGVAVNTLHSMCQFISLDGERELDNEGYTLKTDDTRDDAYAPQQIFVYVSDDITTDLSGYQVDTVTGKRIQENGADKAPYGIFTDATGAFYLNKDGYRTGEDSNVVTTETVDEVEQPMQPLAIATVNGTIRVTLAHLNDPAAVYSSTAKYNTVKSLLRSHYLVLPPSATVVGGIAKTDATRGVWKSPANVALLQVLEPTVSIDNSQQESLNVDEVAGKSINAIRAFVGKGNLIWGARTLAGNDLEWRYISVRRLFNMVEESLEKATAFAVFEPNVPFTWLKLKTMTENYLRNLWQQGALMGASEGEAFFVHVGLGESMTPQDILEGLMKIKIGLAASRPAEFIELTFQHKALEG